MPLSFEKYILEIKQNNKSLFAAEKIQIKPEVLEKLMEKSFHAGFRYCEELKKDMNSGGNYDGMNIFKDIFNKKK